VEVDSKIGDATLELKPTFLGIPLDYDIYAQQIGETQYFTVWRTDGFPMGDYVFDATVETQEGQIDSITNALTLSLTGPLGPFYSALDPNPALAGKWVQARISRIPFDVVRYPLWQLMKNRAVDDMATVKIMIDENSGYVTVLDSSFDDILRGFMS